MNGNNVLANWYRLCLPGILVDFRVAPTLVEEVLASGICDSDATDAWSCNFHGNFADAFVQIVNIYYFCLIVDWERIFLIVGKFST